MIKIFLSFILFLIASSAYAESFWVGAYISAEIPVIGAPVTLETIKGAPIPLASQETTNASGYVNIESLTPLPSRFVIVVHLDESVGNIGSPTVHHDVRLLSVVNANNIPDTVYVGPLSTIMADYIKSHPRVSLKNALNLINRSLGAPKGVDTVNNSGLTNVWFDGGKIIDAAGDVRLDDYLLGLSKKFRTSHLSIFSTEYIEPMDDETVTVPSGMVRSPSAVNPMVAPIVMTIFSKAAAIWAGKTLGTGAVSAVGGQVMNTVVAAIFGETDPNELAQKNLEQSQANGRAIAENGRKLDAALKQLGVLQASTDKIIERINKADYEAQVNVANSLNTAAYGFYQRLRNVATSFSYCEDKSTPTLDATDHNNIKSTCSNEKPALTLNCKDPGNSKRCAKIKEDFDEIREEIKRSGDLSETQLEKLAGAIGVSRLPDGKGDDGIADSIGDTGLLRKARLLINSRNSPFISKEGQKQLRSIYTRWATRFGIQYEMVLLDNSIKNNTTFGQQNQRLFDKASRAIQRMAINGTLNLAPLPDNTALTPQGPLPNHLWWVNQRWDDNNGGRWVGTLNYPAVFLDKGYYYNHLSLDTGDRSPLFLQTTATEGSPAAAHAKRLYWARHDWFKWGKNEWSTCGFACQRTGLSLDWRFPTGHELQSLGPVSATTAAFFSQSFMLFDKANRVRSDQDPLFANDYPTRRLSHLFPAIWLNEFTEAWYGDHYIVVAHAYLPGHGAVPICAGKTAYVRSDHNSNTATYIIPPDFKPNHSCWFVSDRITHGDGVLGILMQVGKMPDVREKYILED